MKLGKKLIRAIEGFCQGDKPPHGGNALRWHVDDESGERYEIIITRNYVGNWREINSKRRREAFACLRGER